MKYLRVLDLVASVLAVSILTCAAFGALIGIELANWWGGALIGSTLYCAARVFLGVTR
ncbi:MAG: hypothetical protein ACYDCO_25570 [Armatimonadota bacterium]